MTQHHRPSDQDSDALLEARVDEVLRRMIVPPTPERLSAIAARAIEAVGPIPAARPRHRFRTALALAAGLGFSATGGWLIWAAVGPKHEAPVAYDPTWRSFETAYRDWTSSDFRPKWTCRDASQFAGTFRTTLNQGLLLKTLPPDTEALGLVVCHSLSPRTTCVLARSGGQPVVVFVDRLEHDAPVEQPAGLNLFRRQIGRLVLYELTPLAAPCLLPAFYNPELEKKP